MIRLLVFLLVFSAPAFGGYANPDHAGKKYQRVLVSVPVSDIELRDRLERAIAKDLRGLAYLSVFSPAKQYGRDSILRTLDELGIDAVLVVLPGALADQSHVGGAMAQYFGGTDTVVAFPVGMARKSISASVTLFDARSGDSAWIDTAHGSGKGLHARESKVLSRLADDVSDRVRRSGFLK